MGALSENGARWLSWVAVLFQETPLRAVLQPESIREEGYTLTLVAATDVGRPAAQVVGDLGTILSRRGESPVTTADTVTVARLYLTIRVEGITGTRVRVTALMSTLTPPP